MFDNFIRNRQKNRKSLFTFNHPNDKLNQKIVKLCLLFWLHVIFSWSFKINFHDNLMKHLGKIREILFAKVTLFWREFLANSEMKVNLIPLWDPASGAWIAWIWKPLTTSIMIRRQTDIHWSPRQPTSKVRSSTCTSSTSRFEMPDWLRIFA